MKVRLKGRAREEKGREGEGKVKGREVVTRAKIIWIG